MSDPLDAARRARAQGRRDDALALAERAAARRPADLRAARLVATLRSETGASSTEDGWRRVLALAPGDPEAHYALGSLAGDRGDFAAAIGHFRAALAAAPGHPQIAVQLGLALEEAGDLAGAEGEFRRALHDERHAAPAYANLARNLFRQRRLVDALAAFDTLAARSAIAHPLLVAPYAACLAHAGRDAEAEAVYRGALGQSAAVPGLRREYAAFLMRRDRYEDAARVLDDARPGECDDLLARSMLLACRLHVADWRDSAELRAHVIAGVAAGRRGADDVTPAYDFLAVCDDPPLQRAAAASWARGEAPAATSGTPRARAGTTRLRLGFVSSDYGHHPVGRLVVDLFERLDRRRFEVRAYATADDPADAFRARLARAVDHYRVLDRRDPVACAAALREDAVDVLFDLNGYSGGEAIRIFAQRPAPVQINFLGYAGTMAVSAYDFIVADRYVIPPQEEDAYAERVLAIDPCYLPSDPGRALATPAPVRAEYRLPDDAFVFCAFASVYKILPELFERWLALLRAVPGSVLWLRDMPGATLARLHGVARRRGIDAARVLCAPADAVPRYLARFRLADLFVDSTPFGSHTTVNDALYAGLPVVTLAGRSFAGRASASQLVAAGLADLVADDLDRYTALARDLALDRPRLDAVTRRLRSWGARSPLFDADRYARAFEAAVERAFADAAR